MFDEPQDLSFKKSGWIEVVTGSMFSGKTEELMRRMRRAKYAKKEVRVFKPLVDTRYGTDCVMSHDTNQLACKQIASVSQLLRLLDGPDSNVDVVGIDEAQFFGDELVSVCETLADNGIRVVVAGLDMDFLGRPFGAMPQLMAVAEFVTKVHAICAHCGSAAHYSHRISNRTELLVLGEKDVYEPLCRSCYAKAMALELQDSQMAQAAN